MKMQGVLNPSCKIDLQKHFSTPDYRAEIREREYEEYRKKMEKEAKTQTGAVKRLIQKISSMAVADQVDLAAINTAGKYRGANRGLTSRMPLSPSQYMADSEIRSPVLQGQTLSRGSLDYQDSGRRGAGRQHDDFGTKYQSSKFKRELSLIANRHMSVPLARSQSRDAMRFKTSSITPMKSRGMHAQYIAANNIQTIPVTPNDSINAPGAGPLISRNIKKVRYYTSSLHLGGGGGGACNLPNNSHITNQD